MPDKPTARFAPPTREEIAAYRDLFRAELSKRMDTNHPSASPSTEAHEIALRAFVEKRNASARPHARFATGGGPVDEQEQTPL